jgi:hypothetical protein
VFACFEEQGGKRSVIDSFAHQMALALPPEGMPARVQSVESDETDTDEEAMDGQVSCKERILSVQAPTTTG